MNGPAVPARRQSPHDRPVAIFVGGPPASGKTTLARRLAAALPAALVDLDVATGPLTALVLDLIGADDLDEPQAARLTRGPRYETVLGLAEDTLAAGLPVVVVAPLSAERGAAAWSRVTSRLAPVADVRLVWLVLDRQELEVRLRSRGAARDVRKLQDPHAYLAGLDASPPTAPHLPLEARRPVVELVDAVLAWLDG